MEEKVTQECKNCSTQVEGHFCAFCGQRYHEHKETFGELVYEFTSDFLHFDSRFFKTILPLLFLPGTLTKSYNEGKQRSQFHPIRLYLFSSFVYFLLFFSFNNLEDKFEPESSESPAVISADSVLSADCSDSLNQTTRYVSSPAIKKATALKAADTLISGSNKEINQEFQISGTPYFDSLISNKVSPAKYIELQSKLDSKHRDGYLVRIITIRLLKINMIGDSGKKEFFKKITERFLHNLPKMLFFLLPVFALLLKLLYIRKKQFYYVDHAVLSLHFFSLIFLLLILAYYILDNIFGSGIFTTLALIWISLYLLLAMKKLYGQSWMKTIAKYITLGFLFLFTILIALFANLALTALIV